MACKMEIKSCGLAPKVLSDLMTSDSEAPAGTLSKAPPAWLTSICERCVLTVVPPENGLGWLITGSLLMTTDKLPWAMAQFSMRGNTNVAGGGSIFYWNVGGTPPRNAVSVLIENVRAEQQSGSNANIDITRSPVAPMLDLTVRNVYCSWATPGQWTEQNFPCFEDGARNT